MAKATEKLKYVQLEPGAFLSDIEYQMMTAEQRGVYCSIIFCLYVNGGKLVLDNGDEQTLISGLNNQIAMLSNCTKIGAEWDAVWKPVRKKFRIKNGVLTHKRVAVEIGNAKKRMQVARTSGLKGAASRWGGHSDPIGNPDRVAIAKRSEAKEKRKINKAIDTNSQDFQSEGSRLASPAANMINFNDLTCKILHAVRKNDQTTIRKIANHLQALAENGRPDAFKKAFRIAQECATNKKIKKPIAVFVSEMKNEMGYLAGENGGKE